jgi:alcohol dehydrogenase (cytochrome c)
MKTLLTAIFLLSAAASAQPNPGADIYRSTCAFCHGMTGTGGRGPSLVSERISQNTSDERLRDIVQHGIPGTGMASFDMEKDDLDALITYIRSLRTGPSPGREVPGNAVHGKALYLQNGCASCHRVGDAGSIYGPELTRIGAARSLDYLRESIANPSADIAPEYEGVSVIMTGGKHLTGVRINEDTFTLQLRLPDQQFALLNKKQLLSIKPLTKSLMPVYKLVDADRDDLVAYLASLRGADAKLPPETGFLGGSGGVSDERLTHAAKEPQNWLTYWGDYSAIRYRTLDQINIANVRKLGVDWIYQSGKAGSWEVVPLVVDGIMYISAPDGVAAALDARSGRELWRYNYNFPAGHQTGQANRGLAILGDRLFMVTPDANVVALDSKTGQQLWQAEIAPFVPGARYATLAPLVVKDKIIVGISGGENGIRGFIDAYDAATGKRVWRFYTVPLKGEPGGDTWSGDSASHGGAPTWMTGTYDPQLQTIYWGTGNPAPDLYGDVRKGDNLYSCSLVALDPDTGKLKWYFQFTPHDTHDWDAAETPMLLDLPIDGKLRKVVVQANRNAFLYVLDRETGEFLKGFPFARQTWAQGLDAKGRPIRLPNSDPSAEGTRVCPGLAGGANWMAPTYDPVTKLFYVPVREACDIYFSAPPLYKEGKGYWGTFPRSDSAEKGHGFLKAIDPVTGEAKWMFRYYREPWAGTLSTSGGLVFAGDEDGYLMAFNASSGELLWKLNTGSRIATAPITYQVQGRQYVTVASGGSLLTFALPE